MIEVDSGESLENDAPVFEVAVEADPCPVEVASFLLRASDADGDTLAFALKVTDDLAGEPVDTSAHVLLDNSDGM